MRVILPLKPSAAIVPIPSDLSEVNFHFDKRDEKYSAKLFKRYAAASKELLRGRIEFLGKDITPYTKLIDPLKEATLQSPSPSVLVVGSLQMNEIRLDCTASDMPERLTLYFQNIQNDFFAKMDEFGPSSHTEPLQSIMLYHYYRAEEKLKKPFSESGYSDLAQQIYLKYMKP